MQQLSLCSRPFFPLKLGEGFSQPCQSFQQWCGLPDFAMKAVKFRNPLIHSLQSNSIRVPHRTTAMCRKSVAIEINNVDIRSAQSVAFLQDARPLVDQAIQAAIFDFRGENLTLRNARLDNSLANQLIINNGIPGSATLVVVLV